MAANNPTFSRKPIEDVELYIRQCKYSWVGVALGGDEKKQAITMTMYMGDIMR